jgi:hypothetical protein
MKNLNIKYLVYLLLGISGVAWFCIGVISGVDLSKFFDFIKLLPKVAVVDLFFIGIFVKWAWKWRILEGWLVPFPNLEGTWQGTIISSWVNPKNSEKVSPIPCILSIKQSFTKVSCVMRTAEMVSYSCGEEFKIEGDNQIRQLCYSYTSKPLPSVNDRSPIHDGTIVFSIIGKPVKKLSGHYWTARKTTGEIDLTYRCKEILDEMPEDLTKHPMKGAANN